MGIGLGHGFEQWPTHGKKIGFLRRDRIGPNYKGLVQILIFQAMGSWWKIICNSPKKRIHLTGKLVGVIPNKGRLLFLFFLNLEGARLIWREDIVTIC